MLPPSAAGPAPSPAAAEVVPVLVEAEAEAEADGREAEPDGAAEEERALSSFLRWVMTAWWGQEVRRGRGEVRASAMRTSEVGRRRTREGSAR